MVGARVNGLDHLDRALEPQRNRRFRDQFGRTRTDHVDTENLVVFFSATIFTKPSVSPAILARPSTPNGKGADANVVALRHGVALRESDAADFRIAVGAARDVTVVDRLHFVTRDALGQHDTFG